MIMDLEQLTIWIISGIIVYLIIKKHKKRKLEKYRLCLVADTLDFINLCGENFDKLPPVLQIEYATFANKLKRS